MEIDERFHHLVYRATRNKFLEDALSRLYDLSARLWYMSLNRVSCRAVREAIREHAEVVAAMEAGDAGDAERIMQRHIASFHERMREVL
jgi:DNA-binding GntR family transcriptional regulator